MKVSVIIPSYNAADTIAEQLDALARQEFDQPWELIIVDNRSTDATTAVAEGFKDRIRHLRVVQASERRGASYARNVGVKAARSDLLLFCDADDVVSPNWLSAMSARFDECDLVISPHEFKRLNLWVSQLYGSDADELERDSNQYISKYEPHLYKACGWGLGVRRRFHELVRGFDESLLAGEDLDFGYRVQLAGGRAGVAFDAMVYYRLRTTPKEIFSQHRRYGVYTVLLFKRYLQEDPGISAVSAWATFFQRCGGLVAWVLKSRHVAERMLIARNAGFFLGTFEGCLKYHLAPYMIDQ